MPRRYPGAGARHYAGPAVFCRFRVRHIAALPAVDTVYRRSRFDRGAPTGIPDMAQTRGTARAVSRLEGEYQPLMFYGRDIRVLKKLKG